ncbi:ATP-binding protein [Streptomyces sp. NPDC087850]|uniref:ATP-binding protein n=1 Tax=Streptomyces sp. NPDC087850 TaxID=3365809 RepID=UPI0037F20772
METVSPLWAYTLQLPHDPRTPGIARTTLRTVLKAHRMSELTDTAELLASELVTNAYRYSRDPYTLRIRALEPDRVRVGVWDSNPEIPPPFNGAPPAAPAPDGPAEGGRGLQLVRMCADDWGVYRLGEGLSGYGGKLLWVECGRREAGCRWGDVT